MAQHSARRRANSAPPPGLDDPKVFAQRVGEAVRHARQGNGWTQKELAEQAGLSPNYVARLERGELGPSLFVANQLCEALGTDLDSLLRRPVPQRSGARRIGA